MTNNPDSNMGAFRPDGLARRFFHGTSANMLSNILESLKQIMLVPLFLRAWGQMVYGEWLALYALVINLSLSDIGIQSYITNKLTQAYAVGDRKAHARIFQSALMLYLSVLGVAISVFCAFVFMMPIDRWFGIRTVSPVIAKATLLMLGSYLLLTGPAGLITSLYTSLGEYPRRIMQANLQSVIFTVIVGFVLFLKGNFIAVASTFFIPYLIILAYSFWDLYHRHRAELNIGFSEADIRLSLSFIAPSLLFLAITVAGALKMQGSVLVIGGILGPLYVTTYVVHRMLANSIQRLIGSFNWALRPELTSMEASGDYDRLRQIFSFAIKSSLFVSFSSAVFLFFTGRYIIRVWTGGQIEFNQGLWLVFLMYLFVSTFFDTNGIFQIATNRHKRYAFALISSALVGIALALLFTPVFGVVGTLAAFFIAELAVCGIAVPAQTLKIIRYDRRDFFREVLARGSVIFLLQISLCFMTIKFTARNFGWEVFCVIFILISGAVASYVFWLNDLERKDISSIVLTRTTKRAV